jgi:hypothetical protein
MLQIQVRGVGGALSGNHPNRRGAVEVAPEYVVDVPLARRPVGKLLDHHLRRSRTVRPGG